MFNNLKQKARPYIPFTALNTVWRNLDNNVKSLLDVGCGKGVPVEFINRKHRYFVIGLDAFAPYLNECKKKRIHDTYVQADVRQLPFADSTFDCVLCLEVLEHLEKKDGEKLLSELERIASREVILSTPVGNYKQDNYDDNPLQEHKYIWEPMEIREKGYKVIGMGISKLNGLSGVQSTYPRLMRWLVDVAWIVVSPLAYVFPTLAGEMVCIKKLHKSSR